MNRIRRLLHSDLQFKHLFLHDNDTEVMNQTQSEIIKWFKEVHIVDYNLTAIIQYMK